MLVSSEAVYMVDLSANWPYQEQLSYCGRSGIIHPTTYGQTAQLSATAAPAAFTPLNNANGNAFLGGEALCNATATSENLLCVFSFQIPSPYTFMCTGVYISVPLNTVAAVATTATIMMFALSFNGLTGTMGSGQRIIVPGGTYTAAVALGINALFSGTPANYKLGTPVACLPGTFLHLGYKIILGTATATEVYRLSTVIEGYWI